LAEALRKALFAALLFLPGFASAGLIKQGPNRGSITPVAAGGTGAIVQSTGAVACGGVVSSTFNATVTGGAGTAIAVILISGGENLSSSSIVDKAGNVYSSTAPSAGTNSESIALYKLAPTGGSNFYITATVSGACLGMAMFEISGVTALDVANGRSATSASPVSQNMPTSAAGVIVGGITHESTTVTMTPGGTYTQAFENEDNATFQCISGAYKTTSSAGTYTFDYTQSASRLYRLSAMAFK
jgi:hypothetical protein